MENPIDPIEQKQEHKTDAAFSVKPKNFSLSKLFFIFGVIGFFLASMIFTLFTKKQDKKDSELKNSRLNILSNLTLVPQQNLSNATIASQSTETVPEQIVPTLTLTGILFSEDGSAALINGRVVPLGGIVNGARVEKIYPHRVELSFDNQTITLRSQ
jgi:glycerol uptake facilitator-like aquaporin